MNEQEPIGRQEETGEKPLREVGETVDIILKAIDGQPEKFSHLSTEDMEGFKTDLESIRNDNFDIDTSMSNIVTLLESMNFTEPVEFLIELEIYQ